MTVQPQYYTVTEGDTLAPIQGIIYKGDGTPQDLTGATVKFNMRQADEGDMKVTEGAGAVVGNPSNGEVKYEWQDADVDTPGLYDGEFIITIGGKTLTFPNRNKIIVSVIPKLST